MSQPIDPIALSALLSSRLCHDLVNPVGAISSGLEVLDDPGMDADMKDTASALVHSSVRKSLALLAFARLAYGAAGSCGAEIKLEDARDALVKVYAHFKTDLEWRMGSGPAAKERVKTLMILVHSALDCAPRGGRVTVTGGAGDFEIIATGPKLFLNDEFLAALRGETEDLKPKFAPAYIAGTVARAGGGGISAERYEDRVVLSGTFGASEERAALTSG
ncbi:MAG: histidine phosphotransferase family protein [Parvularculaceae bacterium]